MPDELPPQELTAEQVVVLDEADGLLTAAIVEARAKTSDLHGGDALGGRCLRCSCEYFIPRHPDVVPGAEAPFLGCMRLGCRHLLTSHVL